jgi:TonB-linked SusC/RagA family outer membrane protein
MKKNRKPQGTSLFPEWRNLLRIMRFATFFLMISVESTFASQSYSQTKRLNLHIRNNTLKEALSKIEEQSEFTFMFSPNVIDLEREVSLTVKEQKINTVLNALLEGTNIKYTIKDRIIVLSPSEPKISIQNLQGKTITGKVNDANGEPLPGVTVVIKGTMKGTITDVNGSFTFPDVTASDVLAFSFIGMKSVEVSVMDQSSLSVVMEEESIGLDEVVAVGYGMQSKKNVTNAISSIGSKALTRSSSTTVSNALAGKMQGITSRAMDARPGRGVNIEIRNMENPLYVIDGIPYGGNTDETWVKTSNGSGADVFNSMSLDDIESISILKDASAAIYGMRASNGVVLVTTKKGNKGESVTINVNGYYGWQNLTRFPKLANAGQYMRGLVESAQNMETDPNIVCTPEELAKWEAGTEPGYKSYDYYDIVMRPNVPQYYLNANASGGTKRSNYYFSVSQTKQDATIREYFYKRTNLQSNLESNIAQGLTVGTQISAKLENTFNVGVPGGDDYFNPMLSLFAMWPTESPYANDNPKYVNQTHNVNVNPATYKKDIAGWVDFWRRNVNANIYAKYDFSFGLSAKGTYSYNYTNDDFDGFEYTYPAYKYNKETDTYETQPGWGNQNPWRYKTKRNVTARYMQFQLNYKKILGNHSISALAAYERSDYENAYLELHSVPSNNYIEPMAFSELDQLGDNWSYEARAGYIGRINYNYKRKYLMELIGRYDGSYLYARSKRWGFFPAFSLGWRISDEVFFDNLKDVVNDLKIRVSYGETGSEDGVSMFGYLGGYDYNEGSAILDDNFVIGIKPRGLPVTNLTWVTNATTDIGIDASFLNNRLTAAFDAFKKKISGIPAGRYDVTVPSEVGYSLPNENLNTQAYYGAEGIVTYENNIGELNYSVSVNATYSRRRVVDTYKPRFGNSWDEYRNAGEDNGINRWVGIMWGYQMIGRFQSMDEIKNYPVNIDGKGNSTMLPGDFIYKDVNNDGIINDMDERPIGYGEGWPPYMSYGFNIALDWKGFNLNLDFAGGCMQTWIQDYELKNPFHANGSSPAYLLTDRWHREDPYDPDSKWISGYYPAVRKGGAGHSNYWTSDFWVHNVRYLRLKNIELGYSLPQLLISKAGASKVRVYINASNLFSLDNVKRYEIDPEISARAAVVYPSQRLILLGANISF